MYLNKLLLKDFGKFNNKEIDLKPGINVVYGKKDSGKSTLKDFVVDMIYGIEKARGIALDNHDERKPRDGKNFSGKAYVQTNNNKYFVERSFLKHNKTMNIMELQSGREITPHCKDSLHGTLINMDKEAYVNSMCIGKSASYDGKKLENDLIESLGAISESGSINIKKGQILQSLQEERAKYDVRPILRKMDKLSEQIGKYEGVEDELSVLQAEIKELDDEFAIEVAKRKREARKMVENENGEIVYEENYRLNSKMDRLIKSEIYLGITDNEEEEPKKKLTDQIWFIILVGLAVVGIIAGMVNILGFSRGIKRLFTICTAIFVVITIIEGLYEKGIFLDEIATPSDEEFQKIIAEIEEKAGQAYSESDVDMSFANEYAEKKTKLKEKEKKLLERIDEKNELEEEFASLKSMKEKCDKERKAISLAMETISSISDDISEANLGLINGNISDIVSVLTKGSCTDIRFDRTGKLELFADDRLLDITRLDTSVKKQVYLSIRLAVARFMCRNQMPVILDDVIESDDEKYLLGLMELLKSVDTEQVIILTSDESLAEKLLHINISVNEIKLA